MEVFFVRALVQDANKAAIAQENGANEAVLKGASGLQKNRCIILEWTTRCYNLPCTCRCSPEAGKKAQVHRETFMSYSTLSKMNYVDFRQVQKRQHLQ